MPLYSPDVRKIEVDSGLILSLARLVDEASEYLVPLAKCVRKSRGI